MIEAILAVILLVAAYLDYKYRAVHDYVWIVGFALVILLSHLTIEMLVIFGMTYVLCELIYMMKWCGGADCKAICLISLMGLPTLFYTLVIATILTGLSYFVKVKQVPYIVALAPAYILTVLI